VHTWKRDLGPKTRQYVDAPIQRGDRGLLLASMEVEEHGRAWKSRKSLVLNTALKKVNVGRKKLG